MDRDEAIMQPVASEAVIVARTCLRLRDLVLVMRKYEIATAAAEPPEEPPGTRSKSLEL